ncbi:MAG: hypothetical protein PHC75_01890 [Burkholderiales bacterium]|nr:hypothetical protein [Burkholderiales bacterium]
MRAIGQPLAMLDVYRIGKKSSRYLVTHVNDEGMLLVKSVYEFGLKHS